MMSSDKGVSRVVNITVYGAKGLKPKKDKHKFCVIFGIGKTKFRTEVVEDLFDNPVFNREAEIVVDDLDLELKFKVTEKHEKDVLGQVTVPLYELGDQNTTSPHKVPLRPHKKCPTPHGLLIFEAWLTTKQVENQPSRTTSMESLKSIKSLGFTSRLKKLKERINISGKTSEEKHKKSSSESLFSLKNRSAVSCQDMSRESPFYIPTDNRSLHSDVDIIDSYQHLDVISELSDDNPRRNSFHLDRVSEFTCPKPEVTSVSPKSGPESGGTILTIRGSDLGQNQDDIVAMNICGSDVLGTLEYISPWKLQCRTVPWKPCVGSISIETLSGGRGVSLVQFTFSEMENTKVLTDDNSESSFPQNFGNEVGEDGLAETYGSRYDDLYNIDDTGGAVPYVETQLDRNYYGADANEHAEHSWIKPSLEESQQEDLHIHSEEDGVLRFSAGRDSGPSNLNVEADKSSILNKKELTGVIVDETSIGVTSLDDSVAEIVTENVVKHKAENQAHFKVDSRNYHQEKATEDPMDGSRSKVLLQTSLTSISLESAVGLEKPDGKGAALTIVPGKQPPPVVEIQPMRIEEKFGSSMQGKTSDNVPPRKPPRHHQERRTSGMYRLNEMIQPSSQEEDILTDVRSLKENEIIKDLEMQLMEKNNEIQMLMGLKKSLQDDNCRMKRYIELIIMRAISICPEVLCVDDFYA